ncbi:hypothetical protein LMG3410_04889 [Achromobacter aegrifaciens]|uniref:hypothetical protein n=1 Tax=Achromobacter aegrifaciens TaxID=1287736 RepID=UPI00146610E6|nr:hypothetical protein [Achromobacter aegrifaciens]CAB3912125.1 hypothetical protein LMG3410_04889 [Achromobacter aegrifaciens]
MIHAGGGSGWGHSTATGGTGRLDAQPVTPSVNISTQAVILNLGISHSSVGGPLGPRISFVDSGHHGVTLLQNLARQALGIGYLFGLVAVPLGQLAAVESAQDEPGRASAQQGSRRVPSPAGQGASDSGQGVSSHSGTSLR